MPLVEELKRLIVEALLLEDVTPNEIVADAPLFGAGLAGAGLAGAGLAGAGLAGAGLGLDSIDALELSLAIEKRYGIRLDPDDKRNKEVFRTVETLARFIEQQRQHASPAGG